MTTPVLAAMLGSYLLGAIPTSYWVVRVARGQDLRTMGSGNLGATNLYRQLGWTFAVPVGLFDALKGAVPVAVFGPWAGLDTLASIGLGVLAVVGHVWSVFVGFRGGKGVATGGGIVLGVAPLAFVGALLAWIVVVKLTGYVSLGSMVSAILLPFLVWVLNPADRIAVLPIAGLALLVIWFHRANIRRLVAGTENRFGKHATSKGGAA